MVDYRRIRCGSCTPTTQTTLCPRTDWSTTGGPGGGSKVSVCWSHAPKSPISRTTYNTLISWTASTAKTTWYVFKSKISNRGKTAWCIFKYKTIIAWQKQYGMHSKAKLHNPAKTTCCVLKNKKQHGIYQIAKTLLHGFTTWYASKCKKLHYMAKIMVFIQLQQQRNHRVSIQL